MKTTVIVSTWDRVTSLRDTLVSIDAQDAEPFDIVVVSDGVHDETRALAASLVTTHAVRWIFHDSHRGAAAVRHTGALASDGGLLVFLDDDMLVGKQWLASHVRAHEANPGHVIVLGHLTEEYAQPASTRLEEMMRRRRMHGFENFHKHAIASGNSISWFPHCGNNSSVLRETYEHFGGFDPAHTWIQQDLEAGERASRAGVRFLYEPAATVIHVNDKDAAAYESEGKRKALADLHRLKEKRQLTSRTDSPRALVRGSLTRRMRERFAWSSPAASMKIASSLLQIAERTGSDRILDAARNLGKSASYWEAMRDAGETLESMKALAGWPVPALLFHAIGEMPRGEDRYYHMSQAKFESTLRLIKNRRSLTLSPDAFLRGETSSRSVLLTFDDGYEDFYTNAFPLLAEHGMRATVFVVAGEIGGLNRWVTRPPRRSLLGRDQMIEMQKYGITFGSHSFSHPHLTLVDDAALRMEVGDSKHALEDMLGSEVSSFAYPGGRVDERVRSEVGIAGYKCAFTTHPGLNDWTDPLMLNRSSMSEADSQLDIWLKLRTGESAGDHGHNAVAAAARAAIRLLPHGAAEKSAQFLRRADARRRAEIWRRRTDRSPSARPLRVLHVIGTGMAGGVETYVLSLLRTISRSDAAMEVAIVGADGPVGAEMRALGIKVHVAPDAETSRIASAKWLRTLVIEGDFDVIHAHTGGRLIRYTLKRSSGAVLINHVHGFPDDWIEEIRGKTSTLTKRVAALDAGSDVIAASSQWTHDVLKESGLRREVSMLPYGVSVGNESREATDACVVGFVGRLIARKGVNHFLQLAESFERTDNVTLVILGDGPLRHEVEARVASQSNILLAGSEMSGAQLMSSLDVLVVPSDWEPLGIVSLEAMAARVPVVAFRVGGIPEVVVDGETGLLVNPGDVSALRNAVARLLDDENLRKQMGRAGCERVSTRWSNEIAAAAALALYREAVNVRDAS